MNALGESSPGFVWRLQTDDGDATALRVYPDPLTIVNLTVWSDVDALKAYAYRSEHNTFVRRRDEWFEERADGGHVALWVGTCRDASVARRGESPAVDAAAVGPDALGLHVRLGARTR